MQQNMMFNTFATVAFSSIAAQPASSDPTSDYLQRCMDSVQELANTISCAMIKWQGSGLLDCFDVHGSYTQVSTHLVQLPLDVKCMRCMRHTYDLNLLIWPNPPNRASLPSKCTCELDPEPANRPRRSGTPHEPVFTSKTRPPDVVVDTSLSPRPSPSDSCYMPKGGRQTPENGSPSSPAEVNFNISEARSSSDLAIFSPIWPQEPDPQSPNPYRRPFKGTSRSQSFPRPDDYWQDDPSEYSPYCFEANPLADTNQFEYETDAEAHAVLEQDGLAAEDPEERQNQPGSGEVVFRSPGNPSLPSQDSAKEGEANDQQEQQCGQCGQRSLQAQEQSDGRFPISEANAKQSLEHGVADGPHSGVAQEMRAKQSSEARRSQDSDEVDALQHNRQQYGSGPQAYDPMAFPEHLPIPLPPPVDNQSLTSATDGSEGGLFVPNFKILPPPTRNNGLQPSSPELQAKPRASGLMKRKRRPTDHQDVEEQQQQQRRSPGPTRASVSPPSPLPAKAAMNQHRSTSHGHNASNEGLTNDSRLPPSPVIVPNEYAHYFPCGNTLPTGRRWNITNCSSADVDGQQRGTKGKRPRSEAFPSTDETSTASVEDSRSGQKPRIGHSDNASTNATPEKTTSGSDVVIDGDLVNENDTGKYGDVEGSDDGIKDASAVQALLNRWLNSSASVLLLKVDKNVT
jgi:hypothetical protein